MLSGSTMIVLFFLELTKKTVLSMHIICLLSLWCHKPSAIEFETRWTLCLADWLSWGLLHLIRGLAIWCQGWNANSVGEITVVARSASSRGPWFPCCTRVEEWWWLCMLIFMELRWTEWLFHTLTVFQRSCLLLSGSRLILADCGIIWNYQCYRGKRSVLLCWGLCSQCWSEDRRFLVAEAGATCQSSSGWWWGWKPCLHQGSSWWCAVGLVDATQLR